MNAWNATGQVGSLSNALRLGDSVPAFRVLAVGLVGSALVALSLSAQTYLSMLSHGHSFWRILSWQLTSWSFWGVAAAPVLRIGGRLLGPESSRTGQSLSVLALGAIGIASHLAIAAQLTVWFHCCPCVCSKGPACVNRDHRARPGAVRASRGPYSRARRRHALPGSGGDPSPIGSPRQGPRTRRRPA